MKPLFLSKPFVCLLLLAVLRTASADMIYVSNEANGTIEQFTPSGVGSLFASTNQPFGLAFSSSGNLYVANGINSTITKFTPSGVGSVFASTGLSTPEGLAFNSSGNLYRPTSPAHLSRSSRRAAFFQLLLAAVRREIMVWHLTKPATSMWQLLAIAPQLRSSRRAVGAPSSYTLACRPHMAWPSTVSATFMRLSQTATRLRSLRRWASNRCSPAPDWITLSASHSTARETSMWQTRMPTRSRSSRIQMAAFQMSDLSSPAPVWIAQRTLPLPFPNRAASFFSASRWQLSFAVGGSISDGVVL